MHDIVQSMVLPQNRENLYWKAIGNWSTPSKGSMLELLNACFSLKSDTPILSYATLINTQHTLFYLLSSIIIYLTCCRNSTATWIHSLSILTFLKSVGPSETVELNFFFHFLLLRFHFTSMQLLTLAHIIQCFSHSSDNQTPWLYGMDHRDNNWIFDST